MICWGVLLVTLLLTVCSVANAATFFCPYEVSLSEDIPGAFERRLSVNRLTDVLRLARGMGDRGTPWDEDEVAGNRAIVTIPDGFVVPAITQALPLGAGCSVVPVDYRRLPARASRVRNGQLHFDDADGMRPIINPARDTRASFQQFVFRKLLASLSFLSERISPAIAYALSAFPDPGTIIDNFNRANETPIGAPWAEFNTSDNSFNLASNALDCSASICSMYYNLQMATNGDAFFTASTLNGQMAVGCRGQQPGAATNDGYTGRMVSSADAVRAHRVDNNIATQLGADATQVEGTGDKIGVRCDGSTIRAYYVDISVSSAWVDMTGGTDSTYTCGAGDCFAFVFDLNNLAIFDDFGFTQLTARLSLGFKLLQ